MADPADAGPKGGQTGGAGGLDFRREPRVAGRPFIQGVREGGFTITGVRHQGSVVVLLDRAEPWPVTDLGQVTIESLAAVTGAEPVPGVLLLGTGARFGMIEPGLRADLKAVGIVVEGMDTRAACRTFNVLAAEDRSVAAALIAL